ncbi:MAG: hypothetical protein HOH66_11360 [Rhodospirillaceae bacterium]|jgi:hypothetical protein|nr:hypothetical protein [Rhodospirillaceae bacterium]MBT6118452.1 hypothetical protein [Rhodospirillaceae bacterium]
MPESDTRTVRIIRPAQFTDCVRSYTIIVDGRRVGKIAQNSVLEFEVPQGRTTIKAQIDWGRSPTLTIEPTTTETIEIMVRNPWNPLFTLFAITFGFRFYLKLDRLSPPSRPA